jgi:chaperone required for assembly of F1-ATPase
MTLRFDAPLLVTTGVVPKAQPAGAVAAIRAAIEPLDDFWLTALHSATTACGSVAIGLALAEERLDAAGVWQASQLDESFQIEQWGEDSEAAARRAALRRDIASTSRFMALLRD